MPHPTGATTRPSTPTTWRGRFEEVLAFVQNLDLDRFCEAATDQEKRVLIDELLQEITVNPDHLEVTVHGTPTINVLLSEVGLTDLSEIGGVGGGT